MSASCLIKDVPATQLAAENFMAFNMGRAMAEDWGRRVGVLRGAVGLHWRLQHSRLLDSADSQTPYDVTESDHICLRNHKTTGQYARNARQWVLEALDFNVGHCCQESALHSMEVN